MTIRGDMSGVHGAVAQAAGSEAIPAATSLDRSTLLLGGLLLLIGP
jgi:hypothetical protein